MYQSDTIGLATFIQIGLNAILVITFLAMASNIRKIKNAVLKANPINSQRAMFYINDRAGKVDAAMDNLEFVLFHEMISVEEVFQRRELYGEYEKKYKPYFDKYNRKFPDYPFKN